MLPSGNYASKGPNYPLLARIPRPIGSASAALAKAGAVGSVEDLIAQGHQLVPQNVGGGEVTGRSGLVPSPGQGIGVGVGSRGARPFELEPDCAGDVEHRCRQAGGGLLVACVQGRVGPAHGVEHHRRRPRRVEVVVHVPSKPINGARISVDVDRQTGLGHPAGEGIESPERGRRLTHAPGSAIAAAATGRPSGRPRR